MGDFLRKNLFSFLVVCKGQCYDTIEVCNRIVTGAHALILR